MSEERWWTVDEIAEYLGVSTVEIKKLPNKAIELTDQQITDLFFGVLMDLRKESADLEFRVAQLESDVARLEGSGP